MENHFISDLESTAAEFLKGLEQFSAEEIKIIPFEGSWSAAQVGEHILKSAKGIPEILMGGNKPAGRGPEEKVAILRDIFLDFDKKMKSPEFIVPSETPPTKAELLRQLDKIFQAIIQSAKEIKLENLYIDYPFPQMGELTGSEWLWFITVHTQRHTRQVHKIHAALMQKQA